MTGTVHRVSCNNQINIWLPSCSYMLRRTMFEQTFRSIDDRLWEDAGTMELDYTEMAQLSTWPTGLVTEQPKQTPI